jgi:Zn-dependent protease/CBS domain-containing protein
MKSFRIGRLFGIPIELDITFLLVLPLFAYLIGSRVTEITDALNGALGAGLDPVVLTVGTLPWILGTLAAVGLFVGVVLHELGHSLVAMRFGFPIDSITLWLFGGIARLSEMPEDWRQELQIAVAGPIVSIAIGVGCYGLFLLVPPRFGAVRFVVGYLAVLNIVLAAFNMLPGFPMDGGRVLRALLARTRSYARATEIAAEVGKAFALLLGLVGLLGFNIILIGLAFFIYIGAAGEAQQTIMRAAFKDVSAGDIMTGGGDVETVTQDTSIAELLDTMLRDRHTGYPVTRNGTVVGMVTLEDAREVDEVERDAYTVGDVMSTELHTIDAQSDAFHALARMQEVGVGRLLVTDGRGEVVGLLSRTDVLTAFDIIKSRGPRSNEPIDASRGVPIQR